MSLTGYFDCFDRRVPVRYIEELDLEAIADYATYEGSNYEDSDALHEAFEAALTDLYEWFVSLTSFVLWRVRLVDLFSRASIPDAFYRLHKACT